MSHISDKKANIFANGCKTYLIHASQLLIGKHSGLRNDLLNPNLGGIFRGSFGGWGVKLTHRPCLKLVRIMLET